MLQITDPVSLFPRLILGVVLLLVFSPSWAGSQADPEPVAAFQGAIQGQLTPRKLALLIGIDEYQYVSDLGGAVNDVNNMKRLLVEAFGFSDDAQHLRVLTDAQATRGAIIRGIEEHLIAQADRDSVVVLHYSGHGSHLKDVSGDEPDGNDETLVPHDSGRADPHPNRNITDDELNELMRRLAEKTPHVTFIFDSCHSGTATRASGLARTVPADTREPPAPATTMHARGVEEGKSGLRPQGSGYALISGAAAEELSYELDIEGRSYGTLTWHLADEIRRAGPNATYRDVMDSVKTRVSAKYPFQHPQLEGPGADQFVFGTTHEASAPYVKASPEGPSRVRLEVGQVHGVTAGSQYG